MRTLFQENHQPDLRDCSRRLAPDSRRHRERLTVPAMLAHVVDQLGTALGDTPPNDPRRLLRFWRINLLPNYWPRWPRGRAIGPREAFTTRPADWKADCPHLLRLLDRFARAAPDAT